MAFCLSGRRTCFSLCSKRTKGWGLTELFDSSSLPGRNEAVAFLPAKNWTLARTIPQTCPSPQAPGLLE
jgi:hypothetical protein